MKNVLYIFNEIKYSGAEIMYVNAVPLFNKEQFNLFAFSTGKLVGDFETEFINQGIKVWHKPIPKSTQLVNLLNYINQAVAFIKGHKIDIVHIHRSDAKWLFAFIAYLAGVSCVYTVHNVFKNRRFTWLYAYLLRLSARKWFGLQFQTISQSVYENEINYYKTPSIHINNWFNCKKFYPAQSAEEKIFLRKKLGVPIENFILISTGSCSFTKNHHAILNAISLLPNKENITYLHLGCGKMEEDERILAVLLGIEQNVHFLGNRINVRDYLIASDLYLMPSRFEGLGNATIEAMACGVPSVLYNVPGLRDLIHDNDNGLLIEPQIENLVMAIEWMLGHPEEAKLKAGTALRFINEEFSMEKNVKKVIRLYLNLLK